MNEQVRVATIFGDLFLCVCGVCILQRSWFLMAEEKAARSNSELLETDSAAVGGKEE